MARTITGTYIATVTLSATANNPVTIGTTANLENGLYGTGSAAWQVTNAGIVQRTNSAALSLAAGGTVINQSGGLITGQPGGGGVYITGNGAVTNQTGGSIYGHLAGVKLTGANATVDNAGTIRASGLISDHANPVLLTDGGSIINHSGGSIVGTAQITGAVGTLTDQGYVTGITLAAGGQITNLSGGTVVGAYFGASGSVTNNGTMGNTTLHAGGGVLNQSSGRIFGLILAGAAPVTNNGYVFELSVTGATGSAVNAGTVGVAVFAAGASITNQATGTFTGGRYVHSNGISIAGAAGTVVNSGLITAQQYGSAILLTAGGTITNASGGTIAGALQGFGINATLAPATLLNAGTISVHYGSSVTLRAGGVITNQSSGSIAGNAAIGGASGTVVNYGTVQQRVTLGAGGSVDNAVGGTIGSIALGGIAISGGVGTVTNAGILNGVELDGGGTITNLANALIRERVNLRVATDTLVNAGSITTPDGISLRQGGGVVINQATGTITGRYTYGVYAATGTSGTVVNAGTISGAHDAVHFYAGAASLLVADPGAVFIGKLNGGNTIGSSIVSTVELASATSAGTLSGFGTSVTNFGSIQFDSGAHWFISGSTAGLAGTIGGFAVGDTIELSGITASNPTLSAGVLTLSQSGGGTVTLDMAGSFTGLHFVANTVAAGTDISLACFARGTRIRSTVGEVAIETLRPGDRVVTASGRIRPVVWIGHRRVAWRRHPRKSAEQPVRVLAGAFGPGAPRRNLLLSPDHAVFDAATGVLIPVRYLVNGVSIRRADVAAVTWWHIELDAHDIVLAEGLTCESFLDTGNRCQFTGENGPIALHPEFCAMRWEVAGCAPLVIYGPQLDAVWRRVNALALAAVEHRRAVA